MLPAVRRYRARRDVSEALKVEPRRIAGGRRLGGDLKHRFIDVRAPENACIGG